MDGGRDLRIDTLRGLALIGMTIAHVNFTGMPGSFPIFGYVGAAEPFVVLSGLVAGTIYWRLAARRTPAEVWSKGLRRTGFVYVNYVGLALGIIALTWIFRVWDPAFVPFHGELIAREPVLASLLTPLFLFQPGYADILPMYIFFVAITPFVVLRARAGRLASCIALSVGLWLLAQLGFGDRLLEPVTTYFGSRLGYFDVFGWQLVYVGGLVLGLRVAQGKDPVVTRAPLAIAVAGLVVVLCFFTAHGAFGAPSRRYGLGWLEDRSSFGPLRVINTAAWVVLFARLGSVRSRWLEWRWPAFLGAHSMVVFVYSCFLGYLLTPFDHTPQPVRVAVVLLGLASLTLPAWLQQRYRAGRVAAATGMEAGSRSLSESLRSQKTSSTSA